MKKLLSLVLCVLLLCTVFSGCAGEAGSGKVVVCFEVDETATYSIESFLRWLDDCNKYYGLPISSEDVEVLLIPDHFNPDSPERNSMLQKIRTDIMAGKGPDVFISDTIRTLSPEHAFFYMEGGRVFPYLEKARDSGFFLPLDDELPNLTLTDVNEMIPQVLEGGKNQAGEQVILPMMFAVPGVIYTGEWDEELPEVAFEGTSWEDVLKGDDPLLAEQVNWFLNYNSPEEYILGSHSSGLFCLIPQVADFETETLYFSEEELTAFLEDSFTAYRQTAKREMTKPGASTFLSGCRFPNGDFDFPYYPSANYSFAPLRNLEGGSTAVVTQYCAVNANTKQKDKALAVIDALMCKEFQKGGRIYQYFFEMPMYRDLGAPESSFFTGTPWELEFTKEQYETWRRICEDINIVRFPSPLDMELDNMMMGIEDAMLESLPADEERYPRDHRLADCTISDETLTEIVSEHYRQMQRLLDES